MCMHRNSCVWASSSMFLYQSQKYGSKICCRRAWKESRTCTQALKMQPRPNTIHNQIKKEGGHLLRCLMSARQFVLQEKYAKTNIHGQNLKQRHTCENNLRQMYIYERSTVQILVSTGIHKARRTHLTKPQLDTVRQGLTIQRDIHLAEHLIRIVHLSG
jgi:hypothetical protein